MKRLLALILALMLCLSATAALAQTEVRFFTGKIETIDLLNEIIDEFNQTHEGVTVEQEYQKDASSIIKVKFASGEVPDVMTTYEQEFVDQGKYLDLSDMSEWWDRLIPSMKESCTDLKTGKQFRVCTNMTMAGFFYNKEIFAELGLTPALTWDEFVANLTVIKEKKPDVTPWFIFGKEAWHLGHLIEFIPHGYLKQSLGSLECKTAMLDNDSAKLNLGAADGCMAVFAQNLLDLQANGLINADVLTAVNDNCVEAFVTGKAAMFMDGSWTVGTYGDAEFEWGTFAMPAPEGMTTNITFHLDAAVGMNPATKYPEEAKAFLAWLCTQDGVDALATYLPAGMYPVTSLPVTLADPHSAELLALTNGKTTDVRFVWPVLMDLYSPMNQAVIAVLKGTSTPQEAADSVAAAFDGLAK